MEKKRVLLLAMADSAHVARWVERNKNLHVELTLLSTSPSRRIHPSIVEVQQSKANLTIRTPWLINRFAALWWLLDRTLLFSNRIRGTYLVRTLAKERFDLIHVMESQNGGYILLRALQMAPDAMKPKILLTLFGSDLYWYSRFPGHKAILKRLMSSIDILSTECRRDHLLARELGFRGDLLPLGPAAGQWPVQNPSETLLDAPGKRKTILVKGYQNKWGRATTALAALEKLGQQLEGFDVVIYSAEGRIPRLGRRLGRRLGISVRTYRKHALSPAEMASLMSRARIHIGLSISDGLPASVIEAAAYGSYFIQSDSSCTSDWFRSGSWSSVQAENVEQVTAALRRVIDDIALLERAQDENYQVIESKFNLQANPSSATFDYKTLS